MTNRQPSKPKPTGPVVLQQRPWVEEVREYEIITFLMGGGVEPYEADPITTVRAAEVKGWLRYWWRATRGGMFNGNLGKMREREAEIWGWSAKEIDSKKLLGQSKVHIEIEIIDEGDFEEFDRDEQGKIRTRWNRRKQREERIRLGDPQSKFGYVAFPLRDRSGAGVRIGVRFKLHIRYPKKYQPEYQDEIEAALWAWETFGGIGARTRRGFGSLKRVDNGAHYPAANHQVENWIRQHLNRYAGHAPWPQNVPHLSPHMALVVKYTNQDPLRVWQRLIAALKAFRQDRYPGSKPNRPGRSKWPEPDEIRRLTGKWISKHKPKHPVRKFPRGQMGLPIVFHFKDSEIGDPDDHTLQGVNHDRWASRLILKPLPYQGGYVGLATVLDGPDKPPGGWKLTGSVTKRVDATLTAQEAQQIPMLDGNPDVLQAFLDFLKSK